MFEDIVKYAPLLFQGIGMTLELSLATMATAVILGLLLCLLRVYRSAVISSVCDGGVYLIRSIPCVMLLVLVHYGFLPLLGIQNSFFLSAYIGLSVYTSVYLSEIFRAGFRAIHMEESEAAASLGLTPWQRLLYVLIPLVFIRMAPALINQGVTLIKDTSLASLIGLLELTRASEIIYERTLREAPLLLFSALIYFLLCYSLSRLGRVKGFNITD